MACRWHHHLPVVRVSNADHHAVQGVVASNGLGGYSGGESGRRMETKRWLLENEGALSPALV